MSTPKHRSKTKLWLKAAWFFTSALLLFIIGFGLGLTITYVSTRW